MVTNGVMDTVGVMVKMIGIIERICIDMNNYTAIFG